MRFFFRRIRTTIEKRVGFVRVPRRAPVEPRERVERPVVAVARDARHEPRLAEGRYATMRHRHRKRTIAIAAMIQQSIERLHEGARRRARQRGEPRPRRLRGPHLATHRGVPPRDEPHQVVRRRDGIETAFLVGFAFRLNPGSLWSPRRSRVRTLGGTGRAFFSRSALVAENREERL